MRIVYRAANIVDAHLARGMLEADGVRAYVTGEFLTGGVGELPAAGLVAVMVADGDVAEAERCLAQLRHDEAVECIDEDSPVFAPAPKLA